MQREIKLENVNLYRVSPSSYDYCYFVFARSRNKAKQLCTHYNDDSEDYIDLRCSLCEKNVNPEYENKVIDSQADKEYEYVRSLGFEYSEEVDYD